MDTNFIKKVKIFSNLSNQEINYFASKLKIEDYKKGQNIITENEISNYLYILYHGEVQISKKITLINETQEKNKNFINLKASDYTFFGEIGLICSQKRTATVTAKTDCQLFSISRKNFMQICDKHPKIGYKVLLEIAKKLAKNLEKTNSDVLKLTTALIYALK